MLIVEKLYHLEWDTHVVVWMNKPDFETMGLDDLYNNFKIVEQKVKRTVAANNDDKNLAFLTTSSPSSTNTINTVNTNLGNMISMKNEGTAQVNEGTAKVNESTAEKIKVPLLFVKVPLVLSDILELEFHRCVFLSYLLAGGNLFVLKWCDEDLSKSSKVSHIEDEDFVKRL
ncbi:hypothetical protein Tco_0531471 [Tanacetum coccineum]